MCVCVCAFRRGVPDGHKHGARFSGCCLNDEFVGSTKKSLSGLNYCLL